MSRGYSHGCHWRNETGWDEALIENKIREVMKELNIHHFPSNGELTKNGKSSLCNAISRSGGFLYWKEKTGLKTDPVLCEIGWHGEEIVANKLIELGFNFHKESVTCPFDFTVGDFVRVDSKYSHICKGENGSYYSCNLTTNKRDCDIYIVVCEDDNKNHKFYVIPHVAVFNQKQISIGMKNSKWNKYENRFDLITEYDDFYKKMKFEI